MAQQLRSSGAMKKTALKSRLNLGRETIKVLSSKLDELHLVVGGDGNSLPPSACESVTCGGTTRRLP